MDLEKLKAKSAKKIKRLKKLPIYWRTHKKRCAVVLVLTVMVLFEVIQILKPFLQQQAYAMGPAGALLPESNQFMASKLKYDTKNESFTFNNGQNLPSAEIKGTGAQQISATTYQDASKGLSVTDPVNKIDFSLTPKFKLLSGKQDKDRIVYPFDNGQGWAVYTMQGTGVKEDIVLKQANGNSATFEYKLGLGDSLEARMEADGSVGVYGSKLFSTNISTGTEKDAALLQKARKNAKKDTFMFSIPRPVILEKDKKISSAQATFTLQGNDLKIKVTGLKKGNYPLTIDPSIYVVTAQQFMNGNNETNIDFDVANKLIKKGGTTGARFNAWNNTTNLPTTRWAASSVAAGGFLYSVGGYVSGTTTASATVSWAKFNTSTGTVDSANPGDGTCASWCTNSAYNLPATRTNFSLVAYNGFLYAFGGINGGTGQNTVYIAKIGANGEPQLWHPTDTDKSHWNYWYTDTNLSSIRSDMSAVAYNNRMYLMGGRSTSGNPVSTVEIADIKPTGTLGTWTGSTALPSNLYGHSSQVYNDRIYILGGDATVGGAPSNSVYYNKINNNGTLNSWVQTTSFATGRIAGGGNMTSAWGAYIYISGGCTSVVGGGGANKEYCNSVASDTQVASINADGSLDVWNEVGGVSNQVMGHSMLAWRNYIYEIGGCSAQNTTTGDCNSSMQNTIKFGTINQDGDASTVDQTVDTSTSPCNSGTPTSCNLPGTTYIGNMLSPTIITNGYLYIFGGCTDDLCSATNGNYAYVAISSTGIMSKPATCPVGTYRGNTWCVDSTDTISGGIAAASPVIFNNRIYLVGGLDGGSNKNTINRADINSDGSLSAWAATQSMTGLSMTSVSYTYAYARANPSSGSNPGNLYVFGGCSTSSDAGCTAYSQRVYKCDIQTAGTLTNCQYNTQLQIGTIPGASGTGLGIMSGTVYANYIYLVGGVAPSLVDLDTVRYAMFNNSNNVVAVSGSAWIESTNKMAVGRRRADAFGYNGYIYVVGGFDATEGVLADIEFIKVNVSDGSLGSATDGFHVSAVTINQRWGLSVTVSNSYAYVIGGCTTGNSPSDCTARTDVIQTFQVYNNDSGAPAGYSTSANTYATNPNRVGAGSTVLNGYLYVAGGCTSTTDCTTAVDTVSYAAIDVNGALGSWSNTTANLPAVRTWGKLQAAGGTLYYMGGQSSTDTDERAEVYYGTPSSGDVTSWGTAANGLPAARTKFGSAVWNNRLYVVGGLDSSAASTATVYVSPQLNAGGNINSAWSTSSTSFNVARNGLTAITYANNIYIFGGYDGTNYLSDSQYSKISTTDGSVGTWTYSTSMPGPLTSADGFAANGYIYLYGGRTSENSCEPLTLVAPISANTTIASGNNPTGVGAWYETNQRYTDSRYGNSAVYNNGKAYVIGGKLCNVKTYTASGSGTVVIPTGVTSIKYKAWSGGGGGGAGGSAAAGGAGGGSGYVEATMAVTAGETLNLYVGGGGGAGVRNTSGGGGGGGGYSSIYRGTTALAVVAGGGGGGGGRGTATHTGGAGGAGGGTTGIAGADAGGTGTAVTGGGPGTPSGGGAAGTGGINNGTAGTSLTGGLGANGRNSSGADGGADNGGVATGGAGGSVTSANYAAGGGGGSGWYGGGGGSGTYYSNPTYYRGGSGGGGGSSYTDPGDTSVTNTAGSGQSPGNSGDVDRGTAGDGGNAGASAGVGTAGSNGKIIITFGTQSYPTTVIQQTALLSQPQVAKYSIMMDTDSDVFPTNWLLNGLDNSIGAAWQLKYRSMPNTTTSCVSPAMTTWGTETNFGDVTLGLPGVYTPLDGSGVTTNCARFYYMNVTIDSSQAFGYPDDVSRGPTISDLTLQFTADPSKRLMHGRTFTGGLQMPDDTPYYSY